MTIPAASPSASTPRGDWRTAGSLLVFAAVIGLLVAVRWMAMTGAGGLWRDEVHSVDVARDVSLAPWHDSFPALWILSLRGWMFLTGAESDAALRAFGFLISLLVVAALLWAPAPGQRIPWVSLVLLGLHPVMVLYGTEVRGYALGVATELLLLGTIWRLVQQPGTGVRILLPVASLLAVHAAYANCFILLSASLGAGVVFVRRRQWRLLLELAGNGLLSAGTMLPYALIHFPSTRDWTTIIRGEFSYLWLVESFLSCLSAPGAWSVIAWGGLMAVALIGLARGIRMGDADTNGPTGGGQWFGIVTLVAGTVSSFAYLKFLGVPTQVWYYLPILALWAFVIDIGLQSWRGRRARGLILSGTIVGILLSAGPFASARVRLTNVDLAAREVARHAGPRDLVIVHPWYLGITFRRYFTGTASWQTVPLVLGSEPIEGREWVKHDDGYRRFMREMAREDPLRDEIERIESVLKGGGKVWMIGWFQFLSPGKEPTRLPPAPHSPFGWSEGAYQSSWSEQTAAAIQRRARLIEQVPVPVEGHVQSFENVPVYVARGWRNFP